MMREQRLGRFATYERHRRRRAEERTDHIADHPDGRVRSLEDPHQHIDEEESLQCLE
jgi:hypothetical protein